MGSVTPGVPAAVLQRAQAGALAAGRWFQHQGWAVRAAGLVVAVLALGGLVYLAGQPDDLDLVALYPGRRFPAEEAGDLTRVLAEAGIEAQQADGRIEVARTQQAAAYAAIRKTSLAPRSLKDLVNEVPAHSFLSSAAELQQRENRRRERMVEGAIQEIDPSLSVVVQLFHSRAAGLARGDTVRATVWLEIPEPRQVSLATIERIRVAVRAFVPELAEDGLMLLDSTGRPYVLAGNPAVAEQSALRAREEELRSAILERLDWIDGVRVAVTLESAPDVPVVEPPAPAGTPPPTVSVNEPIEDEPAVAIVAPAPTVTAADAKATVLVRVPNTYYVQMAEHWSTSTRREASYDDLQALVRQTEGSIRRSVESVVPEAERGEVLIERIFVSGPPRATARLSTGRDGLRWPSTAAAAGASLAVIAVGVTVVALAAGHRQRRRTARRQRREARRPESPRRHRIDLADVPGPSERVRELVRLDPAAAAGVLHRWIGAGGQEP